MSHDGTDRPPHPMPANEPSHAGHTSNNEEALPALDLRERGAPRGGEPQVLDQRLFMQLLVFQCSSEQNPAGVVRALGNALDEQGVAAVIYDDVNDPRGLGVLSWSEDPAMFVTSLRAALGAPGLGLTLRPEFTMLGRSYSTGYEQDLAYWLLERPRATVHNEALPWAVWYPLRRSGAFARLDSREQSAILREHGAIGKAYGAQNLAHDVRLACYGLDAHDNEFVIGLIGRDLYPLSHVVQAMRKTRQTSEFISQMGPFFVGRVAWRSRTR